MCIGNALHRFGQVSGIETTLIDGLLFALTEAGRNPFEFQEALDIPNASRATIEQGVKNLVACPRILDQLNECLTLEEGRVLEFVYDPTMGFKITRAH